MSKHEPIPASDVLAWLLENHPQLHKVAEAERRWLWLPIDLRGDEHKATRESISKFGFAFKRSGVHVLPSGASGTWSHSCDAPLRFIKRGKGGGNFQPQRQGDREPVSSMLQRGKNTVQRADPLNYKPVSDDRLNELAAAFA
jgi:hypothetical protein